jgi:opacity protein-like surface antigen
VCRAVGAAAVAALIALGAIAPADAEDIVGRWRVELHVGGIDPGDSIPSEAGNTMTVVDEDEGTRVIIRDPRATIPGQLAVKEANIEAQPRIDLRAGYGFYAWKNTELYIDFGIGYYEQKIEDIELAYSLDVRDDDYELSDIGNPASFPDDNRGAFGYDEAWQGELINGGEMKVVPVSINLLARFRPTKRLNPYIGGGLGYYFVEHTPSERWTQVADALDQTCVTYVRFEDPTNPSLRSRNLELDPNISSDPGDGSNPCRFPAPWLGPQFEGLYYDFGQDMERPRIETPDSLFLEARAGVEWQWKPRLSFFVDARFTWAAREVTITADGRERFGQGVPAGTFTPQTIPVPEGGLPAYVTYYPGIADDLAEGAVPNEVGTSGEYLLNGGNLDYGGWHFSAGVRFTL